MGLSGGVGASLGAGAAVGWAGPGARAALCRKEKGFSMSPLEGWKKYSSGAGGSSGTVAAPT